MRAVELLQQHDARKLVGKRHRPEGELRVAALQCQAARTAYHEAEVEARLAPLLKPFGELLRRQLLPAAVEKDEVRAVRDPPCDLRVLAQFDQLEPGMPSEQLLVVLDVV